ncbi:MAG: hypothetical protein K2U26_09155 [Cyclobacteriaceae bacterium]|nr:hypothetical protein [Cyclobacteriaceae bacterium]
MKTVVVVLAVLFMMASCAQDHCPTYDRAKMRAVTTAKAKAIRDKTPYYKTLRVAERD